MKNLFALLVLLLAAPLSAQVVAIRAGTVIDPAHGAIAKDQVILVENGKIKSIGAGLAIPAGAQLIDLSQQWVTPGLIDAHTHMTLTEIANAPFESFYLNQSSTLRGLHGLHNVMQALQAGFTAVRDVGNSAEYAMSDVRRAIDASWFAGPTIIDSGKSSHLSAGSRSAFRRAKVRSGSSSTSMPTVPPKSARLFVPTFITEPE